MKKLIALITTLTLLTPALALAEQGRGGGQDDLMPEAQMHGSIKAQVRAEDNRGPSDNSGPGKLGPAIKGVASSTRAELRGVASSTRDIIRKKLDSLHDLIEQHKGDMQKRADDARQTAKEHFGEHVERLVGNVSDRLASSSARLAAIAGRIDARITTLEDEGHNMSAPASLLATAQSDLAAANVKISAVNTALADAMSAGTTTAKTKIPAVRTAVKAAEDALKLVKDDLTKTLRSVNVEAEATTTVSH